MATLTSSSTYAEAVAAFYDNLSYDTDGSVAKAKAFIEACRWLRLFENTPKRVKGGDNGTETELDTTQLAALEEAALEWLQQNDTTGGSFGQVRHPDFCGFRV